MNDPAIINVLGTFMVRPPPRNADRALSENPFAAKAFTKTEILGLQL